MDLDYVEMLHSKVREMHGEVRVLGVVIKKDAIKTVVYLKDYL